jgi:hypothetical protein
MEFGWLENGRDDAAFNSYGIPVYLLWRNFGVRFQPDLGREGAEAAGA